MSDKNPYRTLHARMSPPGAAWDEGFAAGRAAATPDPPEGETLALHLRVHPDTWCVLRRDESVPVGRLRVDVSPSAAATPDPPNECPECGTELPPRYVHEASGWFCGGCARPVARVAAASPDERLREALAFYADKSNYTAQNPVGSGAHVWRDMGQRARAALAADRDSLAEKPETDT